MARLEERGLIVRVCARYGHWTGCNLTSAGVGLAKTVKSQENQPQT
jgi:hypothetical protein